MLRWLPTFGLLFAFLAGIAGHASAAGQAKYFILVVWDGMRPDFVTPELTPTLYNLRSNGVWFAHHHSVYPTATEVNGAVLATGVFPRRSGVIANRDFRPEINPTNQFATESLAAVRRGDTLSGNKYLAVPTIAETLQSRGFTTAVAAAKGVGLLQDRRERTSDTLGKIAFAGSCLPETALPALTNILGAFPIAALPNSGRDVWTRRCLTEVFWKRELPRYSVLWLSEPDFSQHNRGPGSPEALAGIRSADQRLAEVLRELERHQVREQTDVIVVSDHGFSTISENADAAATLRASGLNARSYWEKPPVTGDIMVAGNGGSVLIYVIGRDSAVIRRAVAVLQQRPSSGVVFTRDGLPGTFPLADVMLDAPQAPEIVVATRWTMIQDPAHPVAHISNEGYIEYFPGDGMHVSLNPLDLHNLAVACGPDFRRGITNPLPTGNVDIVPTLLWLMDIKPPQKLDGRVLTEALTGEAPAPGKIQLGRRDARVELPGGVWEQYLKFTELDGVRYIEEGNGQWRWAASGSSPAPKQGN